MSNLMAIDVVGTVRQLVKWVLVEFLYFVGVIVFALSAPLIYTVGVWYCVLALPQYAGYWALAYLFTAPVACCIWMLVLSGWGFNRGDAKWTFARRHARYMSWMVGGFVASAVAEVALVAAMMELFPNGGNAHLKLFFAVAPFVAFHPVIAVLVKRFANKNDEYATA